MNTDNFSSHISPDVLNSLRQAVDDANKESYFIRARSRFISASTMGYAMLDLTRDRILTNYLATTARLSDDGGKVDIVSVADKSEAQSDDKATLLSMVFQNGRIFFQNSNLESGVVSVTFGRQDIEPWLKEDRYFEENPVIALHRSFVYGTPTRRLAEIDGTKGKRIDSHLFDLFVNNALQVHLSKYHKIQS